MALTYNFFRNGALGDNRITNSFKFIAKAMRSIALSAPVPSLPALMKTTKGLWKTFPARRNKCGQKNPSPSRTYSRNFSGVPRANPSAVKRSSHVASRPSSK